MAKSSNSVSKRLSIQKGAEKVVEFIVKKRGKIWYGELYKDDDHNYLSIGSTERVVLEKCKKVAKELGWKVKWKK